MEEGHKTNSPDLSESEMECSPLRSPVPPSDFEPKHFRPPPPPPPPLDKPQSNDKPPPQSQAIIAMERRTHLFTSILPEKKSTQVQPPDPPPESVQVNPLSPVIVVNRSMREELAVVTNTKLDPRVEDGLCGGGGGRGGVEDGTGGRRTRAVSSILWRERKEAMVKRAALGFRVCSVVFCLISFSVMAADKTQGWAGDSFDRYKEYRFCLSITVIGFVYAGFQAYNLAYNLITGKHVIQNHIRYLFDFSMDQILTYLLISASSAAASRVDDWQSNWGKDKFTEMASASIGMSFLAFTSFAFSSLISGYSLCTRNHT